MPLHRIPKCASSQTARLDQLRADRAVEGLRPYLAQYDCFPEGRDPKSSPIREEELKELVKHWKLHRQRNFWRENTTKVYYLFKTSFFFLYKHTHIYTYPLPPFFFVLFFL